MEDIVYHYCNATVFKEIITKKTLRFSDVTKSNDSAEIRWITTYFDSVFREEYEAAKKNDSFYATCKKVNLRAFFNEFENAYFSKASFGNDKFFWFFVSCFSLNDDMLSQWRGYADDGKGFSIGFSRESFEKYYKNGFELLSIRSGEVEYLNDKHEIIVRDHIKALFRECQELYESDNLDRESVSFCFKKCFQNLLLHSMFIKSRFFEEENEWRMCVWFFSDTKDSHDVVLVNNGKPEIYKIDYCCRNNGLVPYFDLVFDPSFVKSVTLGPKNKTNIMDLKQFLANNGFNCAINKSKGTYV